jgi:hypothetical protein
MDCCGVEEKPKIRRTSHAWPRPGSSVPRTALRYAEPLARWCQGAANPADQRVKGVTHCWGIFYPKARQVFAVAAKLDALVKNAAGRAVRPVGEIA